MKSPSVPLVIALFLLFPCAASAQEDPEAVFGKFHRAMLTGNVDQMNRYGTPGGGTEIAKMPAEQRKQVLDMLKGLTPKRYKVTGREPGSDGNSLTLRMTGTGAAIFGDKAGAQDGMIRMVKLGGEWKVDDVKWKDAGTSPAPSAGTMPSAPEIKTGPAKAPCVIKPVMTDEEIERCR
jgi:hypothetical protein